ncbi:MAG: serine hydrolase domain-containing protein [Flavitalea sp.]
MKKFVLPVLFTLAVLTGCRKELFRNTSDTCEASQILSNAQHPLKDSVDAIIARYIAKGIPGIQVSIKNNSGWYITSGGVESLEEKNPLKPCAPGWYFSLTKAYTASLIMKLKERGIINLDKTIDQYLPANNVSGLKGANQVTVRMLLNHTSGIVNFTDLPEYLTRQFTNPADQPTVLEMLDMVKDKELTSIPGTKYNYCNTNYLLLYLMLENITGKSYKSLLEKEIIQPLKLKQTYYDVNPQQAKAFGFPNYYFDRNAKDVLENVTMWNHYVGNASYGWGGIAGTPTDAILFYEALMKGKIVSQASLNEMLTWFREEGSDAPSYGLGIEYWQFKPGSTPQRGHEGDGIGNSTMILYVPDNNTYLFINCTAGRKIFGPYLFKITDFKNELGRYIAGTN